ncbi:hypothetical protein C8J57DRAFT_445752 [Mycena rebaudengoi]|nr:hypothetical protein C8J57DRAFT_445752 [Mycena rebaudengoi]
MRFSLSIVMALVGVTSALAAPNSAESALVAREEDLNSWFRSTVVSIFPNHTGWDTSYPQFFNETLVASFGVNKFDYSSLAGFYGIVNKLIKADGYDIFAVEFTSVTIVPNANDAGGIAVATGLVSGYRNGTVTQATDGVFGVISIVNGQRKITEWHEVSNFKLS